MGDVPKALNQARCTERASFRIHHALLHRMSSLRSSSIASVALFPRAGVSSNNGERPWTEREIRD